MQILLLKGERHQPAAPFFFVVFLILKAVKCTAGAERKERIERISMLLFNFFFCLDDV